GTYWMHSHQGLQEQLLMAAPLIIHDDRDRPSEQEVIVMLADFSFTPPQQIFEQLKKGDSMPSMPRAPEPAARAGDMNAMGRACGRHESKGGGARDDGTSACHEHGWSDRQAGLERCEI